METRIIEMNKELFLISQLDEGISPGTLPILTILKDQCNGGEVTLVIGGKLISDPTKEYSRLISSNIIWTKNAFELVTRVEKTICDEVGFVDEVTLVTTQEVMINRYLLVKNSSEFTVGETISNPEGTKTGDIVSILGDKFIELSSSADTFDEDENIEGTSSHASTTVDKDYGTSNNVIKFGALVPATISDVVVSLLFQFL